VLCISALHYPWQTPEEAFDRALGEFGLDGIEFSLVEGAKWPHFSEADYETVAQLTAGRPGIFSAHLWDDLAQHPDGAGRLQSWLRVAEGLHLRYLVIHGGTHDDPQVGLDGVVHILAEVADEYFAAGVTLCIENHYPWHYHDCHELLSSTEEFDELFARVPSRGVGFCLDYGHAHMAGNTEDLLERVGSRLVYAHIADNRGQDDDHLPFGEGTVPWPEVLAATRASDFTGPFIIECPVRGRDDETLARCLGIVREFIEQ
jgi:sugar phosphate isomerase/epimerase